MRGLRRNMVGGDVAIWQRFLAQQGYDPGRVDGDFGQRVESATRLFQGTIGITQTTVTVDAATVTRAVTLGFSEPLDHSNDENFPPRPSFSYVDFTGTVTRRGETRICDTEWGRVEYVHAPTEDNPEHIRITNSFESDNIVRVDIPQLRGVEGTRGRTTIRWNARARAQLVALWQSWENAGLLPLVKTWAGSYVPRLKRGGTTLSNHALGTAFDINVAWNGLGRVPARVYTRGSVRELVELANQQGFFWGGHYTHRPDGMHFEVVRLV